MAGEKLPPSPDQDPNTVLLKALVGFIMVAAQDPKATEGRALDVWQYEAAGLRTDEDRAAHIKQRFHEFLAGDETLLPFYTIAQAELRTS